MKRTNNGYQFTLGEIFVLKDNITNPFELDGYNLIGLLKDCYSLDLTSNTSLKELNDTYLNPRYWNAYLNCNFSKPYTEFSAEFQKELQVWIVEFVSKINTTLPYYEKMISLFNRDIDDILVPVIETTTEIDGTKGITRYNDTPTSKGNYTAQQFTTTITEVENMPSTARNRVNKDNIIEQLENIRLKWVNLYSIWVEEFSFMFNVIN